MRPPSKTAPSVDVIVRPKVSFETMYQDRVEKDIGGVRLKLASIDDQIALKTGTGRLRDEYDVRILTELKKPDQE
jgi:predicted nucleotidyltransferase